MTTITDKIELPPLPAGYALEVAAAMRNYARAAIEADRKRILTRIRNRQIAGAMLTEEVREIVAEGMTKLDDQSRGEPVAWTTPDEREPISAPLKESRLDLYSKHYTVPLYTATQPAEPTRIEFPAHLRKMWSGGEVQAWLDEHTGHVPQKPTAKGSYQRYQEWKARQAAEPVNAAEIHGCHGGEGATLPAEPCPPSRSNGQSTHDQTYRQNQCPAASQRASAPHRRGWAAAGAGHPARHQCPPECRDGAHRRER